MSDSRAPNSYTTSPGGRGPARLHLCPGCRDEQVAGHRLLCRSCWGRVPWQLKADVWRTWRSGAGAGGLEHARAVETAIAALRQPPQDGRQAAPGAAQELRTGAGPASMRAGRPGAAQRIPEPRRPPLPCGCPPGQHDLFPMSCNEPA